MVILDIEVFKHDIEVGVKKYGKNKYNYYWNKDALDILTYLHEEQIECINFNGEHYDLPLIFNWYFNKHNLATPYEISKLIIVEHSTLKYPKGFFNSIDVMMNLQGWVGLKEIEAIIGWEIRESSINFDYEFKLTESQRREVEYYNKQDLDATEALYNKLKYHFTCRKQMCEFIGIDHDFSVPLPTLVGMGLGAHRNDNKGDFAISDKCLDIPIKHPIKQVMLEQMLKPQSDFSATFEIGGQSYKVGNGGIHSERKAWSGTDVYHVDVKGYYSLLMMIYNLFSRNLPQEGIDAYAKMYHTRLEYKKTNPALADSMKIGLLAIWGATRNYHHILYDRYIGYLITLYGQLFLIYLIELFADAGIEILNGNTDGLVVQGDINVIKKLNKEWEEYGGFDNEVIPYARFVQKDVNNYIMGDSVDTLKAKGRDFKHLSKNWLFSNIVVVPQTPVTARLLAKILYDEPDDPEGYVREHIKDYPLKDYIFIIKHTMKFDGMRYVETQTPIQKVNRCYASLEGNHVEKFKGVNPYKYPNLPAVEMCNKDMNTYKKDDLKIDYDWYVDEIMKRYVVYYG